MNPLYFIPACLAFLLLTALLAHREASPQGRVERATSTASLFCVKCVALFLGLAFAFFCGAAIVRAIWVGVPAALRAAFG